MGAGKTTYGRKLASSLCIDFIDLDEYIEKKHKVTIPSIFELIGESGFRVIEHRTLIETLNTDSFVMSTGGGTPCFYNNMELINKSGNSIYIKLDSESIVARLLQSKRKRPLIQNLKNDELLAFVQQRLNQREPFYNSAKYIIDTSHKKIKNILDEMIHFIENSNKSLNP